jgi:hypothetical protein
MLRFDTHLDASNTDAGVGRILCELPEREARGESIQDEELRSRWPKHAAELHRQLDLIGRMNRGRPTWSDLIRQGVLQAAAQSPWKAELGNYKIADWIGCGGMGIVLKAYEPALDRWVALKLLRPEWGADENAVRRFIREARAAARLQHPNVIAIHAVSEHIGTHFIAMEFVEGASLAELLQQNGCRRRRNLPTWPLFPRRKRADASVVHVTRARKLARSGNLLRACGSVLI